ncbi:acetamidase/formamidase family protein [Streptomyces sp. SBT349]|uniref:acetamidase/formamidase family protein n=1 Tax=Streptomyces sp. SBT349 TaxID=1580539 RepID=UPI00066CFB3C|nr:acetamidase/formamidase family protein [Streptomyces sp. SBT349]
MNTDPRHARDLLIDGLGRRGFLRAASAVTAAGGAAGVLAGGGTAHAQAHAPVRTPATGGRDHPREVLQPRRGRIDGDHYLPSLPEQVRWGYLPAPDAEPVLSVRSGDTVTVDSLSHEGLLEDQGRDPVAWFGTHGVSRRDVLDDAVAIATDYDRTERDFDADGPHVITGPVAVRGAEPGDVLKVEPLSLLPRVPYGVISSRHGKGALARRPDGSAPDGIEPAEVMPPVATDGRPGGDPEAYGNVSVFTPVRRGRGGELNGVLPLGRRREVTFPLGPHMGTMGVAYTEGGALNAPELNSIPPNLGGGNIDISLLRAGSALYLPVFAEGALFYTGDPHFAMADGEVALTAVEGSLRATFRLTVCKPGAGDAPSVAFRYPFGETEDAWLPVGLSDPDGGVGGQVGDLDVAMRRAVVNALDFLEHDQGMDRAVAYAYLSAAADFHVSQVVDRTVGVHATIAKSHFRD